MIRLNVRVRLRLATLVHNPAFDIRDEVLAAYDITAIGDMHYGQSRNYDWADLSWYNCVFSSRLLEYGSLSN